MFALEHPYRRRVPEIHELVLAWLLDDDDSDALSRVWDRPVLRPA